MFSKLNKIGDAYQIKFKKNFSPEQYFKSRTIEKVFAFAYSMSFGEDGEHRRNRSGGSISRTNDDIFADVFQGKLAECAMCNYLALYKKDQTPEVDFSLHKLGVWDFVDVVANGKKISVKSTKNYGNLLLLETRGWNNEGCYKPNQNPSNPSEGIYDFTVLIRVAPSCEYIMKKYRSNYSIPQTKENLKAEFLSDEQKWCYDCPGFITQEDLIYIIKEKYIIGKNSILAGARRNTKIDAENYYVQAGDMRPINTIYPLIYSNKKD